MPQIALAVLDSKRMASRSMPEQFQGEHRLARVIKRFEFGHVSSGAAGELTGNPKPVFVETLADDEVNIFDLTEPSPRGSVGAAPEAHRFRSDPANLGAELATA